jgi:hypothetical protein
VISSIPRRRKARSPSRTCITSAKIGNVANLESESFHGNIGIKINALDNDGVKIATFAHNQNVSPEKVKPGKQK